MKKNRLAEFFKGKGYYVLLFVGVIAIAATAIIGSRLSEGNIENDNYVDLNEEPDNNFAEWEEYTKLPNNQAADDIINPRDNVTADNSTDTTDEVVDNDSLLEYDVFTEEEEQGLDLVEIPEVVKEDEPVQTAEANEPPEAVETAGATVQAENKPVLSSLKFDKEAGLSWPVKGNVIMKYSIDHTVYYQTLMLYKTSPAIILGAEVGEDVEAAARGIVTSAEWNEETGYTVTTAIGDGYSLVYGQLDEATVSFKVGDKVDEGEVIGAIAKPTKYYTVEGSNLYFQVMQDDKTVNPMLLLR